MGLAVWCTDQAGPYQTVPYPGHSWRPEGGPTRQPHDVIVTDPPNQLPTASFTSSVAANGRTVNVNAGASNDPDGSITSYAWTFGPSGTGTGVTSSYTFPADGTYTITLTVTEFELLRFLMRNPKRVLSKAQILDRVWNYDFGGQANVVELYISYLRKKIDAGRAPMIHTMRGVGYVLKPAE